MTKAEKTIVRNYVATLYAVLNGRNIRIMTNGKVLVTIDGNGTQMISGIDQTANVIFAGWDTDLLREASA